MTRGLGVQGKEALGGISAVLCPGVEAWSLSGLRVPAGFGGIGSSETQVDVGCYGSVG